MTVLARAFDVHCPKILGEAADMAQSDYDDSMEELEASLARPLVDLVVAEEIPLIKQSEHKATVAVKTWS